VTTAGRLQPALLGRRTRDFIAEIAEEQSDAEAAAHAQQHDT